MAQIIEMADKKILYVEDNEDTAEAVQVILKNAGFETNVAFCGKECLKEAKNNYDLLLLDVMLPDMSGWDLFTKLHGKINSKFAFLSAIPISKERIRELNKAGVVDYITKPFTKEDLIFRINKILN